MQSWLTSTHGPVVAPRPYAETNRNDDYDYPYDDVDDVVVDSHMSPGGAATNIAATPTPTTGSTPPTMSMAALTLDRSLSSHPDWPRLTPSGSARSTASPRVLLKIWFADDVDGCTDADHRDVVVGGRRGNLSADLLPQHQAHVGAVA